MEAARVMKSISFAARPTLFRPLPRSVRSRSRSERPMKRTAVKESSKERSSMAAGSASTMTKAANKRELSQNAFLPIRSPARKIPIMTKDLTAGVLPPEMPR